MLQRPRLKSNSLKTASALLFSIVAASICFHIAATPHQGPGINIIGPLILVVFGGVVPFIIIPLTLKVLQAPKSIAVSICLAIASVVIAGLGSYGWNRYTVDHNNSRSLSSLVKQTQQLGFTFFLPENLPQGFYANTFLPGSGDLGSSLSYNNSEDYSVSISLDESKVTASSNALTYCNTACTVQGHNKVGGNIYAIKPLGSGTIYIMDYQNTRVMLTNDIAKPLPQSQMIDMLNSLQPQSEQQLEHLLRNN